MNSPIHWLTTAFDGLVGFVPSLIAGLCIMLIGYVLARIFGGVTRSLLARVGYDRGLQKLGLVDEASAHTASKWTGSAVFWLVMLIATMQAARAWNLEMVAVALAGVLAYVPHVIGAAVIFAAALYFGNWVRARMERRAVGSEGASARQGISASAVRAGILAVGGFMALRELQIAPEIVTIAFTATIAAIALAAALAFGLGSRDVAGKVTQDWYEHRPFRNGFAKVEVVEESAERAASKSPPSTL
jgi:Conserved TM helix